MFDWFWEFLYSISSSICYLIDCVMRCANMLCGVENIKVDGKEVDFLTYLFEAEEIRLAFSVCAIVGLILVIFFSVFAIVRTVFKEKVDESPQRIAMKALKTIFTFLCVPAAMLILMWSMNIIIRVIYSATLNGQTAGIGTYLIGAFSKEQVSLPAGIDYTNADAMWDYFNLKKYNYFFSWVAGCIILVETAKSLVLFVDRAISIVVLFIVAPFSISATIIDDGSHFKLWRDQLLVKFLTGYGTIIALNIYAMIISLVSRSEVVFFENGFLNFVMKVLIIIGGAFSLQRIMGLIGNLVSTGAGTQEMQQAAMANAGIGNSVKGLGRLAGSIPGVSRLRGAMEINSRNKTQALADKLSGKAKKDKASSQEEKAYKDNISNVLNGLGEHFGILGNTTSNDSENKVGNKKDNSVANAIKGSDNPAPTATDKNSNHGGALGSAITGNNNSKNSILGKK